MSVSDRIMESAEVYECWSSILTMSEEHDEECQSVLECWWTKIRVLIECYE